MRRGLASLIMGLSLLVASASWAGFILSRTVLDPGRSERLADTLLDNEEVRGVIVDRLADAVEAQIPTEVPVTRGTVETAAEIALDDPRVESLIRDGIVRAHQNALNGIDEPVTIDAAALGAAGRDAVVGMRPELDPLLPQAPSVEVELPNTGLAWLGTVKRYVDRFTLIGAVLAMIGVTTAFVLARNRAAALRRVAFWAFASAAFWIAVAYAIPFVLERIAPSSVTIAMAAVDVFFGAMIRPALILAGAGAVLLLVSFAWPALERRRPAARLARGNVARPIGVGPAGQSVGAAPIRPRRAAQAAGYGRRPESIAPVQPSYATASADDPTQQFHQVRPTEPPVRTQRPVAAPGPSASVDPFGRPQRPTAPGYTEPAAPAPASYGAVPRDPPRPPAPSPDPFGRPRPETTPGYVGPPAAVPSALPGSGQPSAEAPTRVPPEPFDPADFVRDAQTFEPDRPATSSSATRAVRPPAPSSGPSMGPVGDEADDMGQAWVEGVGYVDDNE